MPYSDKDKNREYQRKWAEKRRRDKGIPPRPVGENAERRRATRKLWRNRPENRNRINWRERNKKYAARYGEFAEVRRLLNALSKRAKRLEKK